MAAPSRGGVPTAPALLTPALLPVKITPEPKDTSAPAEPPHSDTIEIEVGGDYRDAYESGGRTDHDG